LIKELKAEFNPRLKHPLNNDTNIVPPHLQQYLINLSHVPLLRTESSNLLFVVWNVVSALLCLSVFQEL